MARILDCKQAVGKPEEARLQVPAGVGSSNAPTGAQAVNIHDAQSVQSTAAAMMVALRKRIQNKERKTNLEMGAEEPREPPCQSPVQAPKLAASSSREAGRDH